LCEDHTLSGNNVKYCIYCKNHVAKLANNEYIKLVPAFKPESSQTGDGEAKRKSSKAPKKSNVSSKPKKAPKESKEVSSKSSSASSTSNAPSVSNPTPKMEPEESPGKETPPEEANTIGSLLQVAMAERESQTAIKSEPPPSSVPQISISVDLGAAQVTQASPGARNTDELAKSKKAKKIASIAALSPASAMSSPIKKLGATKTKRKSLDSSENEAGAAKKKDKLMGAVPSAAKKRKHINEMPLSGVGVVNVSSAGVVDAASVCLDIFGNQLNAAAAIPTSLKTSLEQETQRPSVGVDVAQVSAACCSASLNKVAPMGPAPPALHSYSLLSDESMPNESQKEFPETLEDLLLVKWSLDSEFLMEQSQNFDGNSISHNNNNHTIFSSQF